MVEEVFYPHRRKWKRKNKVFLLEVIKTKLDICFYLIQSGSGS